jgi:hypothetical protein
MTAKQAAKAGLANAVNMSDNIFAGQADRLSKMLSTGLPHNIFTTCPQHFRQVPANGQNGWTCG